MPICPSSPNRGRFGHQAIRDCDAAYKNFFDSLKGNRAGKRMGAPRFKSREDNRQAIRYQPDGFSIRPTGKLRLSKVGDIKVAWSRDLPSRPSSVTIVKTADKRYYCSFVVEAGEETLLPACGRIDGAKPLSARTWERPCEALHDRDRNAAIDILAAGRAERQNACGPDMRPHTGADGDEAGTHRSAA
ncbi:transposase [Actinopolyspora lacussalsi]|uniref:transposase n=1 Tax=Actinopolyspora righensis TaxID=995060 RepID=UPI000A9CFCDA|nr:transposase [Actinopolyspora righensis]